MTIQPHSSSIRGLTVRPSNNNTDSGMAPDLDLRGRGGNDPSFLLIVTLTCLILFFIVALLSLISLLKQGSCGCSAAIRVHGLEEREARRQSENERRIVQQRDRKEYIQRMLVFKKLVSVPKDMIDNCAEAPETEEYVTTPTAAHHNGSSPRRRHTKSILVLDNLDVSRTCPICLCEYTDGDTLCWSHNQKCRHTFHKSCVEAWLMIHDRCPCCRANYLTAGDDGDAANHDGAEGMPPLVPDNSNNEQGQEQLTLGEPITLARFLPSVLDRQYHHASRSLDSGYNSDVSEDNASRSSRSTNDATGEVSDGLEGQRSERQQIIEFTFEHAEGSSSVAYLDRGRTNTTSAVDERHDHEASSDQPTTRRQLHNEPVTISMRDVLSILNEMRGTKSDCNIRYSSQQRGE